MSKYSITGIISLSMALCLSFLLTITSCDKIEVKITPVGGTQAEIDAKKALAKADADAKAKAKARDADNKSELYQYAGHQDGKKVDEVTAKFIKHALGRGFGSGVLEAEKGANLTEFRQGKAATHGLQKGQARIFVKIERASPELYYRGEIEIFLKVGVEEGVYKEEVHEFDSGHNSENQYNTWGELGNSSKHNFLSYFSDIDIGGKQTKAVIMTINKISRVSTQENCDSTHEGKGDETRVYPNCYQASGEIWFMSFRGGTKRDGRGCKTGDPVDITHPKYDKPDRRCWFNTKGPIACIASFEANLRPVGWHSCYKKLGTFNSLFLDEAFKHSVDNDNGLLHKNRS